MEGGMKSKEIYVSFVSSVLLLITFCIVALTTLYTDEYAKESVRHLNNDEEKTESKDPSIRTPTGDVGANAEQTESSKNLFTASIRRPNNRPDRPKTEQWSDGKDENRINEKGRFKLVKFNGREYLEDTTGVIDCNNCDEGAIENIE